MANNLLKTPGDWLRQFYFKRNLPEPTGNPLYTYKISNTEYITLKHVLQTDSYYKNPQWKQCFVMYAAEWWRRQYQGGAWKWDPILSNIQKSSIPTGDRNKIVEIGLNCWKRDVIKTAYGRELLGSIIIEAGLPQSLLTMNNYINIIIEELYQELGSISSTNQDIIDIVEYICDKNGLPNIYRSEEFYRLLLNFVDPIVRLSDKYSLSKEKDPVRHLDSEYQEWRSLFPIRINENAERFLDKLISDVSQSITKYQNDISIKYRLKSFGSTWTCSAYLSIKSGAHHHHNLGLLEEEYNSLSNKTTLLINIGASASNTTHVFKLESKSQLRIDGLDNYKITSNIDQLAEISVSLFDDKSLDEYLLSSESEIDWDLSNPLIFSKKDNHESWELISAGSCTLAIDEYILLTKEAISEDQILSNKLTPIKNHSESFFLYKTFNNY